MYLRTPVFPRLSFLCLVLGGLLPQLPRTGASPTDPTANVLHLIQPVEHQVVQRSTAHHGRIRIQGTSAHDFEPGDTLEARRMGPSGTDADPWHPLALPRTGSRTFDTFLSVPAGGWFTLTVRHRRGDTVQAAVSVAQVGVGEVFLVAGQSNAANHGDERQQVRRNVSAWSRETGWRVAHDPQPGASGDGGSFIPPFADGLADTFGVPIGIIPLGAGGTSVREWVPAGVRFDRLPTVTARVRPAGDGRWESDGALFQRLSDTLRQFGPGGIRTVLWHQGESDANQADDQRTLPGSIHSELMEILIGASRRDAGWALPWFVAMASYHSPEDPGSEDIRAAQRSLWERNIALEGPDTDALGGTFRDLDGRGVHFNSTGLRSHAGLWRAKVIPWLEKELLRPASIPAQDGYRVSGPTPGLILPNIERFEVAGRPAFLFPPLGSPTPPRQPWIFYAPTLPGYPDEAERWMHEQFVSAGIAVAGVDVGEAYGSPGSHAAFEALYTELVGNRGFAPRPCLLGRSRGGLWVTSWAAAHPERAAGLAGIYPVFDATTFPGIQRAAPAYGLTADQWEARIMELNPIHRVARLATAGLPAYLIHGDQDSVVPLQENSLTFRDAYRRAGKESLVTLDILKGEGHNFSGAFFLSPSLVRFAVEKARIGAQ
jgi:hypothetical protein